MKWDEFIFSENQRVRLLRHGLFLFAWWLYFSFCDYLYQLEITDKKFTPLYVISGSHIFLKTLLLVSVYTFASYAFIYFLLPRLIKGQWRSAVVNTLLLFVFLFATGYIIYWNVFPFIDSLFGRHKAGSFVTWFWPAVYLGLVNPTKVVAAAAIIKYVKYWWLKQKESEKLERDKINAELQLLKAQVNPSFLFNTLNNLYVYSLAASPRTPGLLLKLSDLLSYMLYECNDSSVPLEKEIAMMKDYMALEKTRLNESIEIEFSTRGTLNDKIIAPFLLLPFIENSFKQTGNLTEHSWVNLDITLNENNLDMKLANGMPAASNGETDSSLNGLANVQKRLTLIYPQHHELKISREQEMLIIHLKIQLDEILTAYTEKDEEPVMEQQF
jgi:sensor histidine kinase YesM